MIKIILSFLILFITNVTHSNELKPFTSDGCSLVPDGTICSPEKWKQCCIWHDISYWKGGSRTDRKTADTNFKKCLKQFDQPILAHIYFYGVRYGGHPYSRLPFSWGYGWTDYRGYRKLSEDEIRQVNELTPVIE